MLQDKFFKRKAMSILPSWCPPYSSLKIDPNTREELYCICKKPDEGDLMVGCDGCDDWFHFRCVKIPEKYSHLVLNYYCPYCQAGITGKGSVDGELPRIKWKRKCRLETCFDPCQNHSKYCSEEHGKLYMTDLLDKMSVPKRDAKKFVGDMIWGSQNDVKKFQEMASKDFLSKDIPDLMMNHDLFNKMIKNDKNLYILQEQIHQYKNKTYPEIKSNLDVLQNYMTWLESVIKELNNEITSDETNSDPNKTNDKKQGKNKRKKLKKNNLRCKMKKICGFTHDLTISTDIRPEDFVTRYRKLMEVDDNYDQETLDGICVKVKCNRHSEWASMNMDQLKQQLRSLENHKERLDILLKTRIKQLHIQYYEQLSLTKTSELSS